VLRARAKLAAGDKMAAYSDANAAVERAPSSADALEVRAVARFELSNDQKGALEDLDKALAADPWAASAWAQRGRIRYEANDRAGASSDAERALDLDETAAPAHFTRALLFRDDRKVQESLSAFNLALLHDDKLVGAYLERGRLRLEEEEIDAAFHDFRRVLELEPNNARALANHARVLIERKELDAARRELDQAIELDRKIPEAWCTRGQLDMEPPRNIDGAIRNYAKAIELKSNYAFAYFLRGLALMERQRYDEAILDFGQAINLKVPGRVHECHYCRARCHTARKAWPEAIEDYKSTLRLSPVGWPTLQKVRDFLKQAEAEQQKKASGG
jgi:tetratricopeptide (TPR) repeat protein